jgi:hypothetical protein
MCRAIGKRTFVAAMVLAAGIIESFEFRPAP